MFANLFVPIYVDVVEEVNVDVVVFVFELEIDDVIAEEDVKEEVGEIDANDVLDDVSEEEESDVKEFDGLSPNEKEEVGDAV